MEKTYSDVCWLISVGYNWKGENMVHDKNKPSDLRISYKA